MLKSSNRLTEQASVGHHVPGEYKHSINLSTNGTLTKTDYLLNKFSLKFLYIQSILPSILSEQKETKSK